MTISKLIAATWILHVLLIVVLTFAPGPDSVYYMVQALFVIRFGSWAVRAWGAA